MDAAKPALAGVPPVRPMLAQPAPELPEGGEWAFEPKWDGFRTLAFVGPGEVDLRGRNDTRSSRYFPEIVDGRPVVTPNHELSLR